MNEKHQLEELSQEEMAKIDGGMKLMASQRQSGKLTQLDAIMDNLSDDLRDHLSTTYQVRFVL